MYMYMINCKWFALHFLGHFFFQICYKASKSKLKEVNEPPNAICGYTVTTCARQGVWMMSLC